MVRKHFWATIAWQPRPQAAGLYRPSGCGFAASGENDPDPPWVLLWEPKAENPLAVDLGALNIGTLDLGALNIGALNLGTLNVRAV